MEKLLVIDCDSLAWSIFHSLPRLSHDGQSTGIIFGFLSSLFYQQSIEQADYIIFVWDSKKSKRKEIFPEYKIKRGAKKEEMTPAEIKLHENRRSQFTILRTEILPNLGFNNIFMQEGYEGDDIIASVALEYRKFNFIRILGRDNDLYQLINHQCSLHDHVSNKILNEDWFFQKYGIYSDMWAEVKSIAGCPTDEVPGIQGVGYTKAIKYLLNELKPSSKIFQKISAGTATIEFTSKLVVLPFEGTKSYTIVKDICSIDKLKEVSKKYNMKSFLTDGRLYDFKRLFISKTSNRQSSPKQEKKDFTTKSSCIRDEGYIRSTIPPSPATIQKKIINPKVRRIIGLSTKEKTEETLSPCDKAKKSLSTLFNRK